MGAKGQGQQSADLALKRLSRLAGGNVGAENLLDFDAQQSRFFIGRESNAHTLGAATRCVGRRDPSDLARYGVALIVIGQGEQQVDVFAELVIPRCGHKQATVRERRDVSGVQRALFPKHELNDAWAARCA